MESRDIGWRQLVAMGPLAFVLMLAYSLSDNVMTDFIIYNTCLTRADLNISECNLLHENSSSPEAMRLEEIVQPYTGNIFIISSCIQTIFPSILSLFLGPWSDKNGRKPLLVIPFIGHTIYYSLYTILSTMNVDSYWYLLPSIPSALMGGFPAIALTFYCYVVDITDKENRAWHIAMLDVMTVCGLLVGLFLGPVIFKVFSYTVVFALSAIISFAAVLYSIFFVQETVSYENTRTVKSIFDISLVKELFSAITKKRDGFDRCLVWCCISCIAISVCLVEGNGSVLFLYASSKLGFNVSEFSIFSGIQLTIYIIGMLFLIRFVGSVLKLPDTLVIMISCLSNAANCAIKAFVTKRWHLYLSSAIGMFSGSTIPMSRAIISKSVPQKDVGKIFSITTTMEMTVPFATTPVYIYVYTHTIDMFPSPVWLMSSVLPIIMLLLAILIEYRWKKLRNSHYTPFVNDETN